MTYRRNEPSRTRAPAPQRYPRSPSPAPASQPDGNDLQKERSFIAREIHDELGQGLTALKMDLFSLRRGLPAVRR